MAFVVGVPGHTSRRDVAWVLALALGGFVVSYVLVDRWAWPRPAFVLGHLVLSGSLLAAYAIDRRFDWKQALGDWRAGVRGGVLAGAFMVAFVLSGPASPGPGAAELAGAIVWLGVVYGTLDALLLSVFPLLVARRLCDASPAPAARGRAAQPLVALTMCVLLTISYHLGFPEFRGVGMVGALIGNVVMTISGLATRSALAPVLAHVVLHIAALGYGYDNALPAPPHYPR